MKCTIVSRPCLGLRLQVGPQRDFVLGQDAPEEDGGHLARLRRLASAQRAHQRVAVQLAFVVKANFETGFSLYTRRRRLEG
jgi:hypothetical protein